VLFNLGRWAESEAECRAALEWSPSGVAWFSPILYLGLVTVESRADEEASRIVGQILLQLEAVPEGQWTAIVQRTATSFALWRDDLADAQRVAQRGWERVLQTDDWAQIAMAASTTLEVCAAVAEAGRARRDWAGVASAGELAQGVLEEAEARVGGSGMPATLGARREAELHLGMARAHAGRVRGHPDAAAWGLQGASRSRSSSTDRRHSRHRARRSAWVPTAMAPRRAPVSRRPAPPHRVPPGGPSASASPLPTKDPHAIPSA
jgi:hypothetical protein